jgi:hypothetical protein
MRQLIEQGITRPITDVNLTGQDLRNLRDSSKLRRVRPNEEGLLPQCVTVQTENGLFTTKSIRPTIVFERFRTAAEGLPWSRKTKSGNRRGPGRRR